MDKKDEIIAEIRRISTKLNTSRLTRRDFSNNSRISTSTIEKVFGSWNRAIEAAGLVPIQRIPPVKKEIPDEELMSEVIRLTRELQKRPSDREMQALGKYSPRPYIKRWGTYAKGCDVAYQKLGFPDFSETVTEASINQSITQSNKVLIPETIKPKEGHQRKKVQFGEPIDFRGLRFAPINEQGVVYLFGMISRELGFLIESIRTEYPDCEGKRCIDKSENR